MVDIQYFFYCLLLAFSGMSIGFYGLFAKNKIDKETGIGLKRGFDFDSDLGVEYFANRFQNWRTGEYFESPLAPMVGIIIALLGSVLSIVLNSWWTCLVVLLGAYILYLVMINIFKWTIQLISMLTLLVSVILILLRLL